MKKAFLLLSFCFMFLISFNFTFAIVGYPCESNDDCTVDSGEICSTSAYKCIKSVVSTIKCAGDEFAVRFNGETICSSKRANGENCAIASDTEAKNSNVSCLSDFCNSSTKKCENDPDCAMHDKTKYELTTGIPFLGMNKGQCIKIDTGLDFFLTGILRFIFGSVGTLAVIIIIIAGFMWSFSAGNKNTIIKAQKMISDAVIGLVMTLTSGLMLQVINPDLIAMGDLFTKIKPKSVNIMGIVDPDKAVKIQPAANCSSKITAETKAFIQNQAPYADIFYDDLAGNNICYSTGKDGKKFRETLAWSGCGPTSVAKVLKSLGKSFTPKEVATYAGNKGFVACDLGTKDGLFSSIAQSSGLNYKLVKDKEEVRSILTYGNPVVALMKGEGGDCKEFFAGSGHYIVVSCYDEINKSVAIDDPYIWKTGARTSAGFDSWFSCLKNGEVYYLYK